ncbi:MAG: SH3 domain-containing protein [Deltaproteobacteria bacterium]|nr:SH3 domain-containing protein [Deltaproteobacteria bacterium]
MSLYNNVNDNVGNVAEQGGEAAAPKQKQQPATRILNALIQGGETDVAKIASFIRKHPEAKAEMFTLLHQTLGNRFADSVESLFQMDDKSDNAPKDDGTVDTEVAPKAAAPKDDGTVDTAAEPKASASKDDGTVDTKAAPTLKDDGTVDTAPASKEAPEVLEARAMLDRGESDPKTWGEFIMMTRGPAHEQVIDLVNSRLGNGFGESAKRRWVDGPPKETVNKSVASKFSAMDDGTVDTAVAPKAAAPKDDGTVDTAPASKEAPELVKARAMLEKGERDPYTWGELIMMTRGEAHEQVIELVNSKLGNGFGEKAKRLWIDGPSKDDGTVDTAVATKAAAPMDDGTVDTAVAAKPAAPKDDGTVDTTPAPKVTESKTDIASASQVSPQQKVDERELMDPYAETNESEQEEGGANEGAKTANGPMTVTASVLRVRSSPTSSSKNNIIGKLKRGAVVEAVATEGDWVKIKHNDQTAYVHGKYVTPAEPAAETAAQPAPTNDKPAIV